MKIQESERMNSERIESLKNLMNKNFETKFFSLQESLTKLQMQSKLKFGKKQKEIEQIKAMLDQRPSREEDIRVIE